MVYQRQPTNIGLLNNYISAAERSSGAYVRWIGDDDSLEPEYVARTLDAFAEDERRVVVTTQIVYTGTPVHTDYDPTAMSSSDPVVRLSGMLRLLTSGFAVLDPLYSMMRRDLAVLPRRNILREDEVFAVRLALAGPWGHVPAPLARRHRSEVSSAHLVELLGVPSWHRHAMDVVAVPRARGLDRALIARRAAAPASASRSAADVRPPQAPEGGARCRQARTHGRPCGAPITERGLMTSSAGVATDGLDLQAPPQWPQHPPRRVRRHPRAGALLVVIGSPK